MTLRTGVSYLSPGNSVRSFAQVLGITFWLQVALLATAAASVQAAGWVESPPLVLFAFLAALTATLLVNLREHRKVHHLWALLTGGLFAYVGGIYLTEADEWYLKFGELNSRLSQWWSAVIGEDATTDSLPLSVAVIAITWGMAYFTSWGLFRHRKVWAALLPIGMGIIINLTYLPDKFSVYLFVFLFFGLLMLVNMTSLSQRTLFRARGTPHPASIHRLSLVHGMWLSAIILGITLVLPIGKSPASPLEWVFEPVDRVVDDLQDELYRIFAAVPGYNPASIRFFGDVLPLVRPVPTSDDPILFSDARYPLYWPAIAYDQYTSKAWKVGDTESSLVVSVSQELGDEEEEGLSGVVYQVDMYVDSPYLLVAGNPIALYPNAKQNLPASKKFQIDLADPEQNGDLPLGLQRWAFSLTGSVINTGNQFVAVMPDDLLVFKVIKKRSSSGGETTIDIETDSPSYYADLRRAIDNPGTTVGLEVVRTPMLGSSVSIEPLERLGRGSSYIVTSEFVFASEEALRSFPEEYPLGILERYIQVPDSLPERVSVLAVDIMAGATNVYDKAVAIETYLRTLEYTVALQTIPHDADTVDYFLFESGEGYSDYFASAMIMMLRTQGVPSRLVLGFGPGEIDPDEEGFLVRDKDSHSWPEIYFPNVGWVPFEPTPIYTTRSRSLPASPFLGDGLFIDNNGEEDLDGLGGLPGLEGEELLLDAPGGPLSGGEGPRALPFRYFGTPLGMGGALFALFLMVGALLMRVLWMRQYGGLDSGQTAYERVYRLATFLGFPTPPSQTAFEFSSSLSMLIPEASEDVDLVSNSYVRQRYGGVGPTAMEELRLIWAWRRIKRTLMAHLRQAQRATIAPG
jgi:transglutaminase-like putative cysteine protease